MLSNGCALEWITSHQFQMRSTRFHIELTCSEMVFPIECILGILFLKEMLKRQILFDLKLSSQTSENDVHTSYHSVKFDLPVGQSQV